MNRNGKAAWIGLGLSMVLIVAPAIWLMAGVHGQTGELSRSIFALRQTMLRLDEMIAKVDHRLESLNTRLSRLEGRQEREGS